MQDVQAPEALAVRVDVLDGHPVGIALRPERAVVNTCLRIEVEVVKRLVSQQVIDEKVRHEDQLDTRNRGLEQRAKESNDLLVENSPAVAVIVLRELDCVQPPGLATEELLRPRGASQTTSMLLGPDWIRSGSSGGRQQGRDIDIACFSFGHTVTQAQSTAEVKVKGG